MKFRLLMVIIILAFVIITFFHIDYSDLSFNNNQSEYTWIVVGLLLAGIGLIANAIEEKTDELDE